VEASDDLLDISPPTWTPSLRLALSSCRKVHVAAEFLDKLFAKAPCSEAQLFCQLETLLHGDTKADAKGLASSPPRPSRPSRTAPRISTTSLGFS
jgi:hypothetical protein